MAEDILNKILIKVVDIEERLSSFATKEDVEKAKNDVLGSIT